jgi:hypothetical protein
MAGSQSVALSKKSQESFIEYYRSVQLEQNINRDQSRSRYEHIDRAYMRELDRTQENLRAKTANAAGDADRLQNITVPVVKTQVDTATDYQAGVFLTGSPLFGVVADPAYIDQAMQMETVLADQSIRGGWVRELTLHFRDAFKYNYAPIEVDWTDEVTYAVETDLTKSVSQGLPKEVIWSGNRIRRLDPYNTFVDRRVKPAEVYKKGEFAGYTEFISRIELKDYIARLPDKIISNITPAFESGTATPTGANTAGVYGFFVPDINPLVDSLDNKFGGTNWLRWAGMSDTRNQNIDYHDAYELTTMYARVLPSEFNLKVPNSNTPQIYKLIIVNHQWIIYAERQTNAHNYIPILIAVPEEDGLDYQTKSLATDALPFQSAASAYMNSIMASRRRAISDRVLYDPSRITAAHINSANPSAKIPIRPAAYGKPVSEAVYAFPYREDQAAVSMQQISAIVGLANNLAGQNQATQGQFVKGNKTLSEFESVMANSNASDQVVAMLLESQVFTPMKLILKTNILQYQAGTTVYNRDQNRNVPVDPVALRKAILEFRISDGLIPSSKIMNADSFATALQVIGSSPQIAGGYNITQMFSYMMKSQGANIGDFEKSPEQQAYEQASSQHSQLVAMAIDKGLDPATLPPAPLPADFGYDPAANKPAGPPASQSSSAGTSLAASAPAAPAAPPQA